MKRLVISLALFLSGAVVGGAVCWFLPPHWAPFPGLRHGSPFLGGPPDSRQRELWRAKFEERLTKDLGLSDEQKRRIFPMLANHSIEMDAIKMDSARKIQGVLERSRSNIDGVLTPEQRRRFQDQAKRIPRPPFMGSGVGPFPGPHGMQGMPPPPQGERGAMPPHPEDGREGPPPPP